ncbi:MAG: hypothetical protein U9N73_06060 [Candidatus Auribacterota bacterium]|nr:hypothetical protein [Candidatus Auribacterota bacterium]
MRKFLLSLILFQAVIISFVSVASAANTFDILRIRTIPNQEGGTFAGEEVLEITFVLRSNDWVPGVGWSLRYYDKERNCLATTTTAYFSESHNNTYLIKDDYFKGGTVFIALFPLGQPETEYLVFALGDGFARNVQLIPYTALLQDFRIPINEIDREILNSDYVLFRANSK